MDILVFRISKCITLAIPKGNTLMFDPGDVDINHFAK